MFAHCPNTITPPTKEYASNKLSYVKATTSESAEIYCVCVNVVAVYVVAFSKSFSMFRKKKHANLRSIVLKQYSLSIKEGTPFFFYLNTTIYNSVAILLNKYWNQVLINNLDRCIHSN